MKPNAIKIGILTVTLIFLTGNWVWAGNRPHHRQKKQIHRIADGVRSGEINKIELRRLANEQRRIKTARQIAKADGRVTYAEKRQIERMLNRASRHIYQAKHNAYNRKRLRHHRHYHHRHHYGNSGYYASGAVSDPWWEISISTRGFWD